MSTIEINNNSKTVFNLSFDNGLPYKPVIRVEPKLFTQKENPSGGIINLNVDEFPVGVDLEEISFKRLTIDADEVYVDIGDFYIVAWHGSDFIFKSAEEGTLFIGVYHKGNYLYGTIPQ